MIIFPELIYIHHKTGNRIYELVTNNKDKLSYSRCWVNILTIKEQTRCWTTTNSPPHSKNELSKHFMLLDTNITAHLSMMLSTWHIITLNVTIAIYSCIKHICLLTYFDTQSSMLSGQIYPPLVHWTSLLSTQGECFVIDGLQMEFDIYIATHRRLG